MPTPLSSRLRVTRLRGAAAQAPQTAPASVERGAAAAPPEASRAALAKVVGSIAPSSRKAPDQPALLVLVRHGQSTWNLENRFTGWTDVPLTRQGEREAEEAAQRLGGIRFDKAYVSNLSRAQKTLDIMLDRLGQKDVPIERSEALNERHYGELQGLNKLEMEKLHGKEQVLLWRRSFDVRPPGGESLKDTAARTVPYLEQQILDDVRQGKNVLVAAHANSLRSIVMHLEKLTGDEVIALSIENGVPLVYGIDADGELESKQVLAGAPARAAA
jgi:2,3-bisphosphoglycerate-dependent phosphoglycerate mutase